MWESTRENKATGWAEAPGRRALTGPESRVVPRGFRASFGAEPTKQPPEQQRRQIQRRCPAATVSGQAWRSTHEAQVTDRTKKNRDRATEREKARIGCEASPLSL